ncbi:MAG: hypothetical protein J0H38_20235 [Rhizobiales bacterium]|mgnify:FL=1|nr:hypothetical protein [Hyphomicrobiales bacterium]
MIDAYDEGQQEFTREFAVRLTDMAERLRGHLCEHGIATAMIGVGVQAALAAGSTASVAAWLRGIADELEATPNVECRGNA